jgi:RHS repeat-associated protein
LTKVSFKDAAGNEVKTIQYIYDVDNRRIAKIIDADGAGAEAPTTERYVYDGQNIILSFDDAGTQTRRYFYGTGVDQLLADENAQGQVLWTLTDNQGTVRDLIDSAGAIQNHITYDSFGKITSQTNSSITTIFGYTGREYDSETEQYYYRARYYDQNVGKFISEDPLGFAAGDPNIYRYVGNSPTNFIDPLGLESNSPSILNRVFGGLRAIGGVFQAAGGVSLAVAGTAGTAGIGSAPAIIGGGLIAARGADDFQAGIRQLFTGQDTNSLTFEGVKKLTGNCAIAGAVDFGTGLISAGGAVKGIQAINKRISTIELGTACFIPGTLVFTASGSKPIEDIQIGEYVWSYDHDSISWTHKAVTQCFNHQYLGKLFSIEINGETIESTSNHPFWVVEGKELENRPNSEDVGECERILTPRGRWIAAENLQIGDIVMSYSKGATPITNIKNYVASLTVHNLEIDDFHCYAVSGTGILVHNKALPTSRAPSDLEFLNPNDIKFTQGFVSPNFSDGGTISEAVSKIRAGELKVTDFPPINIVEKNGTLFTLDNRRLVTFSAAGVDKIPVNRLDLKDPTVLREFIKKSRNMIGDGTMTQVATKEQRKIR